MDTARIAVAIATLLCTLTAGFLFAFAVVVMPGIRQLEDAAFVRAFQVMDGIIQRNHPLFMFVWVGSVLALAATLVLGILRFEGATRTLVMVAAVVYFLGLQMPTFAINIPMNNRIQAVDVETAGAGALRSARDAFEARWNRWNVIRTALAVLASALLIALLGML